MCLQFVASRPNTPTSVLTPSPERPRVNGIASIAASISVPPPSGPDAVSKLEAQVNGA